MNVHVSRIDPRADMAARLPAVLQPLITWITAMPAPGAPYRSVSTLRPVADALGRMIIGVALSVYALGLGDLAIAALVYSAGAALTVSGLGIVQVVLFHYCAHGGVFRRPATNTAVGRWISIVCLFKYFDHYRHEHIQHHRAQKLITEEDEFATFVVDVCGMRPGMSHAALWRKLLANLVSPVFHAQFLRLRIKGNLNCGKPEHARRFMAFWAVLFLAATLVGGWTALLAAWIVPLVVFLQIATVFRILCEHRIPEAELLDARGKSLIAEATTGVFSGRPLPEGDARSLAGFARWTVWWADMLTLKTLARLIVLVGDASCHDYHHRRSGKAHWPDAIHERAADKAKGCPGFPANYIDVWGLMNAVDQNVRSLADAAPDLLAPDLTAAKPQPAPKPARRLTPAFATAAG